MNEAIAISVPHVTRLLEPSCCVCVCVCAGVIGTPPFSANHHLYSMNCLIDELIYTN